MRKIQIVVASVSALGLIGALGACSNDSTPSGATTDGDATVTVDGKALEMTSKTVVCNTSGGNVNIAVGDSTAAGTAGVGAVVTAGDNPQVQSVALGATNGQALGWTRGVPGGDASATKDGNTYTITGNITGIDMANPLSPTQKAFEIKVTCP